ncbi:MAG: ATP-binding protein [Gemmatimonadota bacterium]|jgi:signal transduction histidine kinase
MGFRARILAAFAVLGILPLIVTGTLGYMVSARLVDALAQARARAIVEQLARGLDHRDDIENAVSWPTSLPGEQTSTVDAEAPLTHAFLVDLERRRVAPVGKGSPPTALQADLALEAATHAGPGRSGDRVMPVGKTQWVVAYAGLPGDRWVLVGLGSLSELAGLWGRARWAYLAFLGLIVIATGAALTFLVQPVIRGMEDLTEAANLISSGELVPWLPARSEGEVGRLSLATGAMVDRVERMMRGVEQGARMAMVGQLATHLAHEIRNPLSSIRLNLQSLARELGENRIPPDVEEVTELCLHEIERLDRVATSVLLVGRARERRPVLGHLHESLRRVTSILGGEMSRRRITLYLDTLADRDDVELDRESMQGVFLNLLMNAAEAIGHDGEIRIVSKTRLDERGDPWIRVEIQDSGPGVPDHLRDRVFEPFYTSKADGTGVGLAIALETVTAHGGSLVLATPSEQSEGASFVLELPLLRPEVPSALPPRTDHGEAQSHPDHRG